MKTVNLEKLAQTILALTWREMQEVINSDGFGPSYSGSQPDRLIKWAEKQITPAQMEEETKQ